MKQFLLPPEFGGEAIFTLTENDFHYLCRVRRLSPGDQFTCRAPNGKLYKAIILTTNNNGCQIELAPLETGSLDNYSISLFFCLPKGKKSDQIIKQATELGVSRIIPVISQNCVARISDPKEKAKKNERWEKIIREAIQQSGSSVATRLEKIIEIKEVPSFCGDEDLSLVLYEKTPPGEKGFHQYITGETQSVSLLIGAEGGLTEKEIRFLMDHRFSPVSFGKNILRAETAVVAGIGAVKILLQESTQWSPSKTFPE